MAEFLGALIFLGLWIVFCLVMWEEEPDTPSTPSTKQDNACSTNSGDKTDEGALSLSKFINNNPSKQTK